MNYLLGVRGHDAPCTCVHMRAHMCTHMYTHFWILSSTTSRGEAEEGDNGTGRRMSVIVCVRKRTQSDSEESSGWHMQVLRDKYFFHRQNEYRRGNYPRVIAAQRADSSRSSLRGFRSSAETKKGRLMQKITVGCIIVMLIRSDISSPGYQL